MINWKSELITEPYTTYGFVFYKMFLLFLLVTPILASCQNFGRLQLVCKLPETLEEVSGIEYDPQTKKLYCIADHGNDDLLYEYEIGGLITKNLHPKGSKNEDWEDLAADDQYFYIADTGNNSGDRKKVEIYIVERSDIKPLDGDQKVNIQKLDFDLPPLPDEDDKYPDIEAIFVQDHFIYLIARDRDDEWDDKTLLYRIDRRNDGGLATELGNITTCKDSKHCQITAADISPSGEQIALLTNSKVLLYKINDGLIGDKPEQIIDLGHYSQKESITYISKNQFYIADEQRGSTGGNLYLLEL